MAKKKFTTPREEYLHLPTPPTTSSGIVDTHTHLAPTFVMYRSRYKQGKYLNVYDFIKKLYEGRKVEAIVDVWCDAPVLKLWKESANSALKEEGRENLWSGMEYWFTMGEFFDICDLEVILCRCCITSTQHHESRVKDPPKARGPSRH